MTSALSALPRGWHWTSLGEISEKPQYGWTTKANPEKGAVKLLRTTDITSGALDWSSVPFCTEEPEDLEKYLVKSGDIVISRAGSVGFSYLLTHVERAVFASYLIRFRIIPGINKKYVYYYLKSPDYWKAIGASKVGIAVPNVNATKLSQVPVPIAPEGQQERIVAEIEKQFSRLDEAVANLKRVKANLKRYKAAVLKAAVEGKLTEEWRKQHPDVEPASELLGRILAERHSRWKGIGEYKEAAVPDIADLPQLPEGWAWTQLGAIAALKGGITVDKKRRDSTARTVPYLRVANVQRGYLDLAEVKQIEAPATDIKELRLLPGDILFNEGGDRDKLGRGWIWEGQLPECIHQNHVFRARPFLGELSPKLISWWGNTFGKDYFLREGKQTTNLASINLTKLSRFPVPLAPVPEQQRIAAEVDRLLSVIEELRATAESNLNRADRLRQSILGHAFAGHLVSKQVYVKSGVGSDYPMAAEAKTTYRSNP